MRNVHNELLDCVEGGEISADTVLRVALQWMGDHEIERMVNECPDFDGLGLADDEDENDDTDDGDLSDPFGYESNDHDEEGAVYHVTNIKWDTDGEDVDLPTQVTIYVENGEEVADAVTEKFGWCIFSLDITKV